MRRKRPYTEPDRIKERIRAAIDTRRTYHLNKAKYDLALIQADGIDRQNKQTQNDLAGYSEYSKRHIL